MVKISRGTIAVLAVCSITLSAPVTHAETIKQVWDPNLISDVILLPQSPLTEGVQHNDDAYLQIISLPDMSGIGARLTVENESTVTQYLSVRPAFQRLGRREEGDILSKKLEPGTQSEFIFPITNIPFRKGPGNVTIHLTYTPSIDELPEDAVQQGFGVMHELEYTTHIFFMPREIIGVIGIVFLLTLLRPRGNKSSLSSAPEKTPKKRSVSSKKKAIQTTKHLS